MLRLHVQMHVNPDVILVKSIFDLTLNVMETLNVTLNLMLTLKLTIKLSMLYIRTAI